jgi:hypothetical protein
MQLFLGMTTPFLWQNPAMSDAQKPGGDRRKHARNENRVEMFLGASCSAVSNLSMDGAFVSILSGLHPGDTFSFELAPEEQEMALVRGKAVVVWTDPGVGVGVRFELTKEEEGRLADYLEELTGVRQQVRRPPPEAEDYDVPRRSRRTVAVGPTSPGGESKVWIRYLPPDESA